MPTVHLFFEDAEGVARAAAERAAGALAAGARTLVLAGGSVNVRCAALLADMDVAWGRVTALFGDERCVPPDHPDSNYRQVREALFDRATPATIHRMPGELGPEAGAGEYEDVLRGVGQLDVLMLGMGPDGHTASLFPGNPALEAEGLAVGVHNSPKPPPERISLTLPALRSARHVLILAAGADKAEAVARAARGEVPAGLVEGATWLVDRGAGSLLGGDAG